mmetsp:Transcript_31378/g.27721  ORF Transcript_31378/g.27721 Transcript_31378/m.27721 type:complete len:221 (+) Transcript_31378:102-764(+)
MALWKDFKIACPFCRTIKKVNSPKDIPCTNYAIIKLQERVRENGRLKKIKEKYEKEDPLMFQNIQEEIGELILSKVTDDEIVYSKKKTPEELLREKVEKLKVKPIEEKYVFTTDSYINYLLYPHIADTKLKFMTKKLSLCTHKYSCFERCSRVLFKVFGTYRLAKLSYNYFLPQEDNDSTDTIFDIGGLCLLVLTTAFLMDSCVSSLMFNYKDKKRLAQL